MSDETAPWQHERVRLAVELAGDLMPSADGKPVEWKSQVSDVVDAVYVWEPIRGGRSILIADDGTVLFANSSIAPADHAAAFAEGRRTPLASFR